MSEATATKTMHRRKGPLTELIGVDDKDVTRGHARMLGTGEIVLKLPRCIAETVEGWKEAERQLRKAGLTVLRIHEWSQE